MEIPKVKYNDVRDDLQTFDVLNCVYGDEWWNPVHWILGAVGHTAMVYVCKETDQIMIYESTQTGRADKLEGVQLRPMKEWLQNYRGKVYLRRTTITSDGGHPPMFARVRAELRCGMHVQKYRGTAYPNLKKVRGLWFLANAAIDLPVSTGLENPDIDIVMFCTHLFGHVFRFCDMIKEYNSNIKHRPCKAFNPAELEPDDLRPGRDAKFIQYLKEYVHLGPEMQLVP